MQGDIGELLRSCRLRGEMTQKRLASLLRVHDSVISRVETGEMPPSYALVKQWAKVTKCEDMISMDLAGCDSWKKLKEYKDRFDKITELVKVSFMRIRKEKRHAVKARG